MKILLVVLLFAPLLFAQTRFDGTWEMKMDTLEFSGPPEVYVVREGMFHCVSCTPNVDVRTDGNRHKVIGQPHFDTASIRIVDANAVEFAYWKNGTATFACTETVSPDGKSMVEEFTETPASERVTGHATFIRVANGPINSHALSGSWEMRTVRNVSSIGPLTTYRITKDGMALSAGPEHFQAKFDGKDYLSHNDRQETNQTVSLRLVDENTIEETTKRDGRIIGGTLRRVSSDGKSMKVSFTDKEKGKTMTFTAEKQP